LTSASSRPNLALIFAIASRALSAEVRSTPPSSSASAGSRSARPAGGAAARSSAATKAPRRAAASATTWPSAPNPPVTTIALPFIAPP